MRIRKILLLLMLPFIMTYFFACCECDPPVYHNYTNKSLQLQNIDNSGAGIVITDKDSVIKTAYGFRVNIQTEQVAFLSSPAKLFFTSASAYSCRCPEPLQFLPKDSITNIEVITLKDFDANHTAGSDISDYFMEYKNYTFQNLKSFQSIASPALYDDSSLSFSFDLLLMQAPERIGVHEFKLIITLSDNRVFEEETIIKLY